MTQKSLDGKVKFVAPRINRTIDLKLVEDIRKTISGKTKFPLYKK